MRRLLLTSFIAVMAGVVSAQGPAPIDWTAVDAEALRAFLAPQFARWQVPDAFVFIDAIPRTSTGKFFKAKLRERYAEWQWPA